MSITSHVSNANNSHSRIINYQMHICASTRGDIKVILSQVQSVFNQTWYDTRYTTNANTNELPYSWRRNRTIRKHTLTQRSLPGHRSSQTDRGSTAMAGTCSGLSAQPWSSSKYQTTLGANL